MRNIVEKIVADARCPADTGQEGSLVAAERMRLARNLHDSFPQEFQAIILQLRLALSGACDPQARLHILNALRTAEAGLHKTHEHIVLLREPTRRSAPATPPHWPAWDELVAGASRAALTEYGLALDFAPSAPDVRIAPELGAEVASIVAEAVRNAAKYGGVPVIGCRTYFADDLVAAEICDQGPGMPSAKVAQHGFGICGMRERAAQIGAAFELRSGPDTGTSVYIALRLPHSGIWPNGMRLREVV